MKENSAEKQARAKKIIARLEKVYPGAKCALSFNNPFELLAATILSAQCTDKRVNMVTPVLFKRYPKVENYAEAQQEEMEEIVRTTGFYKNKAKNIIAAAKEIVNRFGGKVPDNLEDLVTLPGVGRKTANVLLGNVFGIPGLTVDTHMIRMNNLLGFTKQKDAVKIEYDLMKIIPQKSWTCYSDLIIHHGRARCVARRPDCPRCEILDLCPSGQKNVKKKKHEFGTKA